MEIIIGENAGFCFGVKRAVEGAKELVKTKRNIYCLGELVHNRQVIEALEKEGMQTVETIEEVPNKCSLVIFRAHGVAKEIYEHTQKRKLNYQDFTCPKVLYVHKLVKTYSKMRSFCDSNAGKQIIQKT